MEKVRVHEIAKELGITSKEVVKKATDMGLDLKTASSTVSMEEAEKIVNYIMNGSENEVSSEAPKKSVPQDEKAVEPVVEVQVSSKNQETVQESQSR